MHITYDDDSEIVMFHAYDFLAEIFKTAISNNGDGEILLKKSGISSLCERYQQELTPHSFNGQWKNGNVRFNPKKVFFELYPELDDKHKFLFLKNIVENANFYWIDTVKMENYLSAMGYALIYDSNTSSNYTLNRTTKGLVERGKDITLLEEKIKNDFPELYRFYDEALSTFGNGEYKSCIDNCRSLFETIAESIGEDKTDKSVLNITGEEVRDGTTLLVTKEKIYRYWLDNRKGANRYRYFTTLYSLMSGLGMEEKKIELKPEYFLSKVKTRLDKIGFSQKDFANAIGVSQNTISSWFSDNKKMQPHGLQLILSIIEFFINHPLKVGDREIVFDPASLFVPNELNPLQEEISKMRTRNAELSKKLNCAEKERDELSSRYKEYRKKYEDLYRAYQTFTP